jgi:hypothetical protein
MYRENDFRDRDEREADSFMRHLDLPEGPNRERVGDYSLRGSESRVLATVGAFRAVPKEELLDGCIATERDLDKLRQEGLIATTPFLAGKRRTTVVTLTDRGLELLESQRHVPEDGARQQFYAGVSRPKELGHDIRLYSAYLDARSRMTAECSRIRRVVLEQELKTNYQRFLQEPNRRRWKSGGGGRDVNAISDWASSHGLPVIEDSVRFPDVRIEYERPDGTLAREDLEIVTEHYRGSHASRTQSAGFRCYRSSNARLGGRGSNKGGRSRDVRLAEEML